MAPAPETPPKIEIVALEGELDGLTLPQVSEQIDALLDEGATRVVLNLRALRFINSAALAYLVKTLRRLEADGGDLLLSEPSRFLRSTIRVLGLDEIFWVFPSDEEAVAHFRKGA